MNKTTGPEITPSGRSRRSLLLVAVCALMLLAGGLVIRQIYHYADPANYDSSPLPRVLMNAPFIKTPDLIVNQMVEMAKITDQDLVFDLGCGDGRLVIGAATASGCRGVGFDIEPKRIDEARANAQQQGVGELVTFEQKDIFEVDLRDADVVMMYLLPWMLEKLIPQLENCEPGTRIVSHDFWIEGIEAEQTMELPTENGEQHYIHLYIAPLKKSAEKK